MSRSRTSRSLFLIAAILAASAAAWAWLFRDPEAPATVPPRDPGPVPVQTLAIERRDLPIEIHAHGTLLPARRLVLAFELGGRLETVAEGWRTGLAVEAGATLLTLEALPFELEVAAANAALKESEAVLEVADAEAERARAAMGMTAEASELASKEYDRAVTLEERGTASSSEVDRARRAAVNAELAESDAAGALRASAAERARASASLDRAQLNLDLAEERLRKSAITAPFSGRLRGDTPEVGAMVVPGEPLAELVHVETLHLALQVFEDDLAWLRLGLPARVTLPSRPNLVVEGEVRALDPQADPLTRAALVEVELRAPEGVEGFVAGVFASARIDAGIRSQVLWIDRRWFRWDAGVPVAFVEADGHAERRELVLGDAVGEGFVLESGLASGERLILEPLDLLVGGEEVRLGSEERSP